jgi:hypothetical protein
MNKTQIYILGDSDNQKLTSVLKNYKKVDFKLDQIYNYKQGILSLKQKQEIHEFLTLLKTSESENILLLKSDIIPIVNDNDLNKIIEYLEQNENYDIAYLSRWLDRCDLIEKVDKIEGTSFEVIKPHILNGTSALYFNKKGKNKILSMFSDLYLQPLSFTLNSKNINKIAITPNPFQFDYTMAKSKNDYLKTSECKIPLNETNEPITKKATPIPLSWYLFIVLGFLFITIIIINVWG